MCGIGISNGLFARNTRQQVYPTAVAGVGSEECLAAACRFHCSCAAIFHAFAVCVQLKDVIGLAAVQSVKGDRLFALVAGCNVDVFLFHLLIAAICVLRKQSNLNCMVNCRIAVLSSDLRYFDLSRILGGVCDNGVCLRCVLGQGKCRNLIVVIAAVIRNIECRICFRSGILGIENNRHLERSTVFDTLVTVHFKNVVRDTFFQIVPFVLFIQFSTEFHLRTGSDFLSCADLCVIVSVLGEQSHGEYRCALDIICDQHLADGDAVLGFFKVSDCSSTACLYCRPYYRYERVADTTVRSVSTRISCISRNAVGIGFQYVEIHTLGHIFKCHVLRACLGKGQGLHRCFLIANIIACRILGEQGKIESITGDVSAFHACQCLGQRDIAHIFGVGHADSLVRCGISSGDLIVGICRCVIANLIALGICFQQVNIVGVVGLLLDRGQVYVLHGDGSRGLSCRNGDGNHITQPCGVIFIGEQCKVERCVLGFCCCQGLVDLHINGSVRCLYPDADLCRLCYHDSIAQNVGILIGVREAVPCDVFLAGLCHIAGNGCGNFDNNLLANLDGRILQLDPEVYGIRRGNTCPVHDIVLSQPVLGVLIQDGGLVGGIAVRCICTHICSAYRNRINALEFHAECGETLIAGNQTQVTHIGQTVDNGHVFQIYRRVVLDVEFIGHIFTLHALHVVVGGLAAVTGIGCRVSMRCAGVILIGIGNGLPRFCGQANDIIVCITPDLVVLLFAGNRIFCGERLVNGGVTGVGDNALAFLSVLDSGGELEDDALVLCQRCLAQFVHRDDQFCTIDLVGIAGNRCAVFQQAVGICFKCRTAISVIRQIQHLIGHLQAGFIAELVGCRQIVGQCHTVQFQVCHIGGVASAVVQRSLPDQGITGGDVAVSYLLHGSGIIIGLSCKGGYCQLGEAGCGSGFGEADVHLAIGQNHTVAAVISALHHSHLGKGVGQCDFFRCAVRQFLCLVSGQFGFVSQFYATVILIFKFFCGNKCKGQRLSVLLYVNATQSCIICSSRYTIWHIFHAVRQGVFQSNGLAGIGVSLAFQFQLILEYHGFQFGSTLAANVSFGIAAVQLLGCCKGGVINWALDHVLSIPFSVIRNMIVIVPTVFNCLSDSNIVVKSLFTCCILGFQ